MAQEDPRTLYDQKMGEESGIASIERVGNAGNYSYHFREEEAEESVMFIDLRSAMRFCNWKENGEQKDLATMEHGVYELNGDQLVSLNIDETTTCFLPSEQDEKFSSMEGVCLRLGSFEDPASWLRSNQVVFHLKGRLENMVASLSHEEPSSLEQDAGYVAGSIAAIAAVATCFKYRDGFCPGRAGDKRIPDPHAKTRLRDITANGSADGDEGDEQRGDSSQLHARERTTTSPSTGALNETEEQLFKKETQAIIDHQILPRTQKFDQFEHEDPKYVAFMKNNFEKNFEYKKRTDALEKLIEPYMAKLDKSVRQATSPTLIGRIVCVVRDPLAKEHAGVMNTARKYCSDFDASWARALEGTQKQHDCFLNLQLKDNWINTTFLDLVREKEQGINTSLNEGAVGEVYTLRTRAIKKFFEQTFRREFAADREELARLAEETKAKLSGYYQQVEALHFWDPSLSQQTAERAQGLLELAHEETEILLNAYRAWKSKMERVIARAGQRYDAVNHQWPPDEESSITAEQKKLVEHAISLVHTKHEINPFYPSEEEEQRYYQQWIQSQYNEIQQELYEQRSFLWLTTYTSAIKRTLPEHEKEVLRYFLSVVEYSPFDFIRDKAAALRKELDPDLENSDDSF